MTGTPGPRDRPAGNPDLAGLVDAAQRAAGVLAARHRHDPEGVAALMNTFPNDRALAGGSLLLAEIALGLYRQQTGQSMDECVHELATQLENAVTGPP
ncbi:hypothetical protein [Actinopolymorpha singaporensis]|uniref:Superoxide dismutase, Fe-Mn family n=1 Tax=Actinopolymorpha singaporensis TaxID=117157 RepID=A0A1H1PA22_9ACTN|nr:hypothetical protein [Actinopolymorpha singaporensis]SDS08007.1 superoxide dismutase, Fe-Mn family [Actinopolymorpha singaporensis]